MAYLNGAGFKPTWAAAGGQKEQLPATRAYAAISQNAGGLQKSAPSSFSVGTRKSVPTSFTAGGTQKSAPPSFTGTISAALPPANRAYGLYMQRQNGAAGGQTGAGGFAFPAAQGSGQSASYSPLSDVQSIYNYKTAYTNAKNAGDMDSANQQEALARKAYLNLIQNGKGDIAAALHASDVQNASNLLGDVAFDDYAQKYRASADAQAENAYRGQLSDIDEKRDETERNYRDNARAAYISYLQSANKLPQQLKAAGMTGGLTESGGIALANNYGEQAAALDRDRLSALTDYDREALAAKRDLENQKAETTRDLAAKAYEKWATRQAQDFQSGESEKDRKNQQILQSDSQAWQSRENAFDRAQDNTQFYDNLAENKRQFNENLAWDKVNGNRDFALSMAENGYFDDLARQLNTDPDTLAQSFLAWLYNKNNAAYGAQYDAMYGAKAAYTVPKTSSGTKTGTGTKRSSGTTAKTEAGSGKEYSLDSL